MDKDLVSTLDLMEKKLNCNNKEVSFYLLNTKYKISLIKDKITIKNSGFNSIREFNTIDELFSNYYIYGRSLIDYLDEIKIIE